MPEVPAWVTAISSIGVNGVLVVVLWWLLWVHLPAKDKYIKDMMDGKDAQITKLIDSKDALSKELASEFKQSMAQVVAHCADELKDQRENTERRYREVSSVLQRIYESSRENIHVTRNVASTIQGRQHLAEAIQSAEIAVWTKGTDGMLLSWNKAAERLMGWRSGEVVGRSIYEKIIPSDKVKEEGEVLQRVARGESVSEYETTRMHKDGRHISLLLITSPILDTTGRIIGASTLARPADH
jgi:PAS domain S-box-containing protein